MIVLHTGLLAADRLPPVGSTRGRLLDCSDLNMGRWHKGNEAGIQFMTGSLYRRTPLFREEHCAKIFLHSLDYCRARYKSRVYGFVIMPDHFHVLVGFPGEGVLSNFLRDWKGYSGRMLVRHLIEAGRQDWLVRLRLAKSRRKKDSKYRVFQSDTQVEGIFSQKFFQQKIDYIHKNPVRAGLVQQAVEYPYSSARSWFLRDHSIFRIDLFEP